MPQPQPVEPLDHQQPFSLESFEGASYRLALAFERAEIRTPKQGKARERGGRPPPTLDHQKELVKLINSFRDRHTHWQVFADFCELGALTFSNVVDQSRFAQREARYFEIVKRYRPEEITRFAEGIGHLTMALEHEPSDVLGRVYHELELHNKWAGQYFTPFELARAMAKLTIGDGADTKAKIAARGFVTTMEPAVGSGAMVIALTQRLLDASINYQQQLHVVAVDVDPKCVHMAYLQFSLLYIPAVVIHGNSLSGEEYSRWYTPAHVFGEWNERLEQHNRIERMLELLAAASATVEGSAKVTVVEKEQATAEERSDEPRPPPSLECPPAVDPQPEPKPEPSGPPKQLKLF